MSGRSSEPIPKKLQDNDPRRDAARRARPMEGAATARGPAELHNDAVIDGRYRILRRPSRWVVGNAYPAHDLKVDAPVVVVLPEIAPDQAAGFGQRARVDAQRTRGLDAHHIVTIRDCGVLHEGLAWFSIRRVAGTSLLRHVKAQGALKTDVALHLFEKLIEQVAAAHAASVCLGDLRPANIILAGAEEGMGTDRGGIHPEIVDMGFARGVFDGLLELPAPPAAYRSPQRRRGDALTPSDDLYALGAVLYFMLTGRAPHGDDLESTQRPIPAPSAVRPDLDLSVYVDRVVLRSLSPKAEDRYVNLGELLEAVRGLRELFRLSPAAREVLQLQGEDEESRVDAFESDPTAEFAPSQVMPKLLAARREAAESAAPVEAKPEAVVTQPPQPRNEAWYPQGPPAGPPVGPPQGAPPWPTWQAPDWGRSGQWPAAPQAPHWPHPGPPPAAGPQQGPYPHAPQGPYAGPGYPHGAPYPPPGPYGPGPYAPQGPFPHNVTGQYPSNGPYPPNPGGYPHPQGNTGPHPMSPSGPLPPVPYDPAVAAAAVWPPADPAGPAGRRGAGAPLPPMLPAPANDPSHGATRPGTRSEALGLEPLRLESEPGRITPALDSGRPSSGGRWAASVLLVLLVFGGVIAVAWTLQSGAPAPGPVEDARDPSALEPPPAIDPAPQRPITRPAPEPVVEAPPPVESIVETPPVPPPASTTTPVPPEAPAPAPEVGRPGARVEAGARSPEAAVAGPLRLEIVTLPPGARVYRARTGDLVCPTTPCVVEQVPLGAGKVIRLRLERAGHATREVGVPASESGRFAYDLKPTVTTPTMPELGAPAPPPVSPTPRSTDAPGLRNPFD